MELPLAKKHIPKHLLRTDHTLVIHAIHTQTIISHIPHLRTRTYPCGQIIPAVLHHTLVPVGHVQHVDGWVVRDLLHAHFLVANNALVCLTPGGVERLGLFDVEVGDERVMGELEGKFEGVGGGRADLGDECGDHACVVGEFHEHSLFGEESYRQTEVSGVYFAG